MELLKETTNKLFKRCVNVDWLEVFCLEPVDFCLDVEYFKTKGWEVRQRAYGTPQYREMFTLYRGGEAMLEVRRCPYSLKSAGGVFDPKSIHLRLTNRACYQRQPVRFLQDFIADNGLRYKNVTRLDICVDMLTFDDGKLPADFINEYMRGEYFKVHLCRISGFGKEATGEELQFHGHDAQFARVYNSVKWGSPSSMISVKLYNKTQELEEATDKAYIRNYWYAAGLLDADDNKLMATIRDDRYNIHAIDVKLRQAKGKADDLRKIRANLQTELEHLKRQVKQIWRVEVSMKSDFKGIVAGGEMDVDSKGRKRIYEMRLDNIDDRQKQLFLFHVIANKYFWFKIPSLTRDGRPQRKDRCRDYWPLKSSTMEFAFKPSVLKKTVDYTRTVKMMLTRLRDLMNTDYWEFALTRERRAAIVDLLHYFGQVYGLDELRQAIDNIIIERVTKKNFTTAFYDELINYRRQLDDLLETVAE